MKTDKKKIVFIGAILLTVAFIVGYYFMVLDDGGSSEELLREVTVPELIEAEMQDYETRKEAVDAIEEERRRTAPSVYDDRLLDSLGRYDPDLLEKDKQRMVDSIYRMGRIDYTEDRYTAKLERVTPVAPPVRVDTVAVSETGGGASPLKAMALEQQLFFAVSPQVLSVGGGRSIEVAVDGKQTVRANDRLVLRVLVDGELAGIEVPANGLLYGIVKFRPNRLVLEVSRIGHRPVKLVAVDLADGLEGIYVRNSYREEVVDQVIGDMVEDINIPGVPQVSGIQRVFQRNHRNVKVTVGNGYRLLLVSK